MLRRFVHNGRLLAMPAAHGKRLVVLDHLAGLFEPGRRYPEREVNELLGRYHPDYAMLRRYLVDDGFLDRADEPAPSGSRSVKVYWRTGGTIELTGRSLLLPEALAGLGEGGVQGVAQRPGGLLGLLADLRVADGVAEGAERLLERVGQLLEGVVDLAPVGGRRGLVGALLAAPASARGRCS